MRFRTKQRPRGLLRPTDQVRLTLLVAGFGIVLLGFSVAKRPQVWNTLFGEQTATGATDDSRTELQVTGNSLRADEFFAAPADKFDSDTLPAEDTLSTEGTSAADNVQVARKPVVEQDGSAPVSKPSASAALTMPEDLLKNVHDDVIGVHSDESVAYYAALKMAAMIKPETAAKLDAGSFALFMDATSASRGKAFTIDGRLRRLSVQSRAANEFGVGTLYDAWLTTADSGDRLVHVVAMSIDEKLKPADAYGKHPPDVRFTGYFLKREGYATRDSVNIAPLFLAGALKEIPEPAAVVTRSEQLTPYLWRLTLAVCAGIAFIWWSFHRSDLRHQQSRVRQLARQPATASFEGVSSVSVKETLHQLEADANRAESPFPELRSSP
ncbi:MAG: hypothetical protein R3C19_10835 [Planctomycetaceae bacterium]